MLKTLTAFVLLCLLSPASAVAFAHAEESQPKAPVRFSCWTVRKAVKLYSEAELAAMAHAMGISEKEIEMAKRCLKP